MRNVIWTGVCVTFLGTISLFLAGQHAVRHRDSFLGRWAAVLYQMWEPEQISHGASQTEDEASEEPPTILAEHFLAPEPIEPIVVTPTDQEPPLGFPRLSPEVAAAIERLRSEEESTEPPVDFEAPRLNLRMPYVEEETPPATALREPSGASMMNLELSFKLDSLIPPSWRMLADQLLRLMRPE